MCATEAPITETFSISPDERPWNEYYEADDVLRLVEKGESVFLCGYGGTGKTFAARAAAQRLMEKGRRVIATAYTHVAAQNIKVPGAVNGTLHHCLHKYPCWGDVVVIDEASQIPVIVWAAVLRWLLSNAQFIVLGDFHSQFGAAYDRWRTQAMLNTDTENSAMFKRICGHNRVNFTTYRRGDDRAFLTYTPGL